MPNYHLGAASPICYPTGVEGPAAKRTAVKLYPNPVNDQLHIEYGEAGVLEISDMAGRRLRSVSLPTKGGGNTVIDLQALPAGVCVCRYYVDGQLADTRKLVIGLAQ